MKEEFLSFTSREATLYGTLGLPAQSPTAGVVIVHGWSGCRMGPHRILVETCRHFNRRGMATLRFDLGGRGESQGDPFATDLDAMFHDTSAALDLLRSRLPDGCPVGLLGMCSGGNVALGTLTMRDDVRAAVCWSTYPFQSQRESRQDIKRTGHFLKVYARKALQWRTWKRLLTGAINFKMIARVLFGHYRKDEAEPDPYESARDEEIVRQLADFAGPLYFLFGGNDPEAADARDIFEESFLPHGHRADFEEIAGANHNFYSLRWKREAITRSGRWLEENLCR